MTEQATKLRESFVELPASCYEPLTFGELKVGDRFIVLPRPGDNHVHGGFRVSQYTFLKIEGRTPNTVRLSDARLLSFQNSMYVIKIN